MSNTVFEYFMKEELRDLKVEAHRFLEEKKVLVTEASLKVVDALTYKYKKLAKPLLDIVHRVIDDNFKSIKE